MQRHATVAMLKDLVKQKPTGRMTIGIDLGDRRSHFCALNDQGQVIARGFLPTTITAFRREFEVLPTSLVAIEAGTHSLWASQVLKVCGHDVLVGNPRKIRLITESDRKSDRVDAESLARLARADRLLLAPIQHRTQEKQVELSVIRARHVLVRSRTALINCARGLVKPMGLRLPASSPEAFAKRAASTCLPEILRTALAPLLKQIEAVNQAIRDYDRQIEQIAGTQYPETCLLQRPPLYSDHYMHRAVKGSSRVRIEAGRNAGFQETRQKSWRGDLVSWGRRRSTLPNVITGAYIMGYPRTCFGNPSAVSKWKRASETSPGPPSLKFHLLEGGHQEGADGPVLLSSRGPPGPRSE
jgi:transposase